MRNIVVSTDVYAALWGTRQPGEDSEDDILRRVLALKPDAKHPSDPAEPKAVGFRDPRFGIEVPEGFEVFRIYKGTEYRARASGGKWILNGKDYPSFNQLSKAIGVAIENAWFAWYFLGSDGKRHHVSALRDKGQ